ncbi:DnaT-like ssDNA-binding protein [Aquamicrobium terrae]|uniref:Putative DnaT-like domain-containing protein n=1 Tax=Aquamicrobium terrae TaxID=1324945 RepID=A0ABV2MY90_9HYPH
MAGYGSDGEFEVWLSGQGLSLPADAPAVAALRQRGSDYVDATYGPMLTCSSPTGGFDQERAWPRTGHRVSGQTIADDVIPTAWVRASYRAAWLEATNPGWASGSIDPNRRVKRQKVDTIEREFFDSAAAAEGGVTGVVGNVDAGIAGMVTPFLCPEMDGIGIGIWSIGP